MIANCPPLSELTDDSFKAIVRALADTSALYNACREAALVQD